MAKTISLLMVFTLFLGTTFFLKSCRKKHEEEVTEFYDKDFSDLLCFNGLMDTNELGKDCGGPCKPCTENSVGCSVPLNVFHPVSLSPRTITSTEIDSSGSWVFRAYMSDDKHLEFHFSGKPDISLIHVMDLTPSRFGEVRVTWFLPPSSLRYGSGSLIINYQAGHYILKACDVYFPVGFDSSLNVNFNISF